MMDERTNLEKKICPKCGQKSIVKKIVYKGCSWQLVEECNNLFCLTSLYEFSKESK